MVSFHATGPSLDLCAAHGGDGSSQLVPSPSIPGPQNRLALGGRHPSEGGEKLPSGLSAGSHPHCRCACVRASVLPTWVQHPAPPCLSPVSQDSR